VNKVVTSTTNAGVKEVVKLRTARHRRETGLFPVEGYREIKRALEGDIAIHQMWCCPELFLGENEDDLVDQAEARGAEIIEVTAEPFQKMSYRDRPEGLLAVCHWFDTSLESIELSDKPLVLVVESIEKPGNLGTMLRAATAAGVDAVVVADPTTDVFNPNVVRSSIGTCFLVSLAVASTDEAIAWLRKKELPILGATPDATLAHWDAPLNERAAIVVGSEQYGLSQRWLGEADTKVVIPMPGTSIDSLNAAAAAAILLFEAVRQRTSKDT
jgi:TrmH family RNA methyltransferase